MPGSCVTAQTGGLSRAIRPFLSKNGSGNYRSCSDTGRNHSVTKMNTKERLSVRFVDTIEPKIEGIKSAEKLIESKIVKSFDSLCDIKYQKGSCNWKRQQESKSWKRPQSLNPLERRFQRKLAQRPIRFLTKNASTYWIEDFL